MVVSLSLLFSLSQCSHIFCKQWSTCHGNITSPNPYWLTHRHTSKNYICQLHFQFSKTKTHCSFILEKNKTKKNRVIPFKALIVQGGKGKDWSGKLNLQEPLCTQRPSQGHFLLGGLRAPFLLMEGKQNRWDTNCTFIHLKVQGNFPSTPVKFSDCLSILWAFHSSKGFRFVQCLDSYTYTKTYSTPTCEHTRKHRQSHPRRHPQSSFHNGQCIFLIIAPWFARLIFRTTLILSKKLPYWSY